MLDQKSKIEEIRTIIDSDRAPSVVALNIIDDAHHDGHRHLHTSGQLYCLQQGLMMVDTDTGLLATPPRLTGWIPPEFEHSIAGSSVAMGWTVFIKKRKTKGLPEKPTLLRCSGLVPAVVERLSHWPMQEWQSLAYARLCTVLLDELCTAEVHEPTLPLPQDKRLRAVASLLIENPADPRTGAELAVWSGISPRSLSRHWSEQVGMSFSKYRQIAKVLCSLDGLSQGKDVQQTGWDVGFESTGAYIKAFKAFFGSTPGQYAHDARLKD